MNKYDVQHIDLDSLIFSMRKVRTLTESVTSYIITPEDFRRHVIETTIYGESQQDAELRFVSKFPSDKFIHIDFDGTEIDLEGTGLANCRLKYWFWTEILKPTKVTVIRLGGPSFKSPKDRAYVQNSKDNSQGACLTFESVKRIRERLGA